MRYEFGGGGVVFGGAYTWRGLFLEFYGITFIYFYLILDIPRSFPLLDFLFFIYLSSNVFSD